MMRGWLVDRYIGFVHFIVMRNYKASFAADKCLTYIELFSTAVIFSLKVGVVNIIACALKITEFRGR